MDKWITLNPGTCVRASEIAGFSPAYNPSEGHRSEVLLRGGHGLNSRFTPEELAKKLGVNLEREAPWSIKVGDKVHTISVGGDWYVRSVDLDADTVFLSPTPDSDQWIQTNVGHCIPPKED